MIAGRDQIARVGNSVKSLETFEHETVHGAAPRHRDIRVVKQEGQTVLIRPVSVGHRPADFEAIERLNLLGVKGPTDLAFEIKGLCGGAAPVE